MNDTESDSKSLISSAEVDEDETHWPGCDEAPAPARKRDREAPAQVSDQAAAQDETESDTESDPGSPILASFEASVEARKVELATRAKRPPEAQIDTQGDEWIEAKRPCTEASVTRHPLWIQATEEFGSDFNLITEFRKSPKKRNVAADCLCKFQRGEQIGRAHV